MTSRMTLSAAHAKVRLSTIPRDMFRLLAYAERVYSGHAFGWFRMDLQQTRDSNVSGVVGNARLSCGAKLKKKKKRGRLSCKRKKKNDDWQ